MSNQISASSRRLLWLLKNSPRKIEPSSVSQKLLLYVQQGAVAVTREDILALAEAGLIQRKANELSLLPAGQKILQHSANIPSARRAPKESGGNKQSRRRQINDAESPLVLLHKRKGVDGLPFLTNEEFLAGERLRADFTKGHMMPSVTMRWDATTVGRNTAERGAAFNISDSALESRNRVNDALRAVGPELSGLLVDICCFLKGIELVERERKLPVRSAKTLLKVGLSILNRHYCPPRSKDESTATITHWGAPDYRPQIHS